MHPAWQNQVQSGERKALPLNRDRPGRRQLKRAPGKRRRRAIPRFSPGEPTPDAAEPDSASPSEQELTLSVDGTTLEVSWEDNETVRELMDCAAEGSITVNASLYGGFEQVGSLPRQFSRNDEQMTTAPGDIVLYSGDQLVLFFGSNSWSYTKLGHIDSLTTEELTGLLGGSSAEVEISLN